MYMGKYGQITKKIEKQEGGKKICNFAPEPHVDHGMAWVKRWYKFLYSTRLSGSQQQPAELCGIQSKGRSLSEQECHLQRAQCSPCITLNRIGHLSI